MKYQAKPVFIKSSPYFSKLKFKYSNNTTQKKKTYLN